MGFPKLVWILGFDHSFEWDVIETHINLSAFLVSLMINRPLVQERNWDGDRPFTPDHETISQIKLSKHSK